MEKKYIAEYLSVKGEIYSVTTKTKLYPFMKLNK
jgi:hypothetical protein